MKFLQEERVAVALFIVSVGLLSAILYFAGTAC
jgi:hypothetical protein